MSAYPAAFVEFFGPSTWKALHAISFTYAANPSSPTPAERQAMSNLLGSLGHLLPCPACREHYRAYMSRHPPDVSSRDAVSRWLYELHADVNRRRGETSPSFEEVKQDYTGYGAAMSERLQSLSPRQRRAALADPHLGRSPAGGGVENLLGGDVGAKEKVLGVLALVTLVGLLTSFALRRREGVSSSSEARPREGGEEGA
mmetsp:Transcript_16002/g.45266  ORF Transcript_16002/g.45266 Transcript_16002/m.45266 type:complete len:200 (+) Transcript_16002:178-777(+)